MALRKSHHGTKIVGVWLVFSSFVKTVTFYQVKCNISDIYNVTLWIRGVEQ